jgi:hypothetical protein
MRRPAHTRSRAARETAQRENREGFHGLQSKPARQLIGALRNRRRKLRVIGVVDLVAMLGLK